MATAADCSAPTVTFPTISLAILAASPGDTIIVCPGLYPEAAAGPLTVNKTLTLLGARAGVDARTRVGAESIVTDPQGTSVSASNVVIDGFTVEKSIVAAFTGFGIWLNPGVSGTVIVNNIIQDNIVGIGLANAGPSQALIRHNLIQNNNQPGAASGDGIYTDQFVSGGAVTNVLIEENAFSGNTTAGIDVSNTDPANGVSNLNVSANSFDMNGRAVLLFNTHMSSIHNNSITNSTASASAAIRLLDNNSDLSIVNNNLGTGLGHAIFLSDLNFVDPGNPNPSSNVVINCNNIEDFAGDGLRVAASSHVGTVNAERNWWNSSTGPMNVNNPSGTGEAVTGDADFTPFLIAPAPSGACLGPDEEDDEEDDEDFDEDGEEDGEDGDDDNDGEGDDEDGDDDNDGSGDDEDGDDDNDGIDDEFDSESSLEQQQSSSGTLAGGEYTEYTMASDSSTLLLIGLVEAPKAEFLTVEIRDPAGLLVGVSPPTPRRALATAPGSVPGTYTVRVRNSGATPVDYMVRLIKSVPLF